MTRQTYDRLNAYMLSCMRDSAHDCEHIYRVLHAALDIAAHEEGVDLDILICACLLHDIGRDAQFQDPTLCHAAVGAEMARIYLLDNGFGEAFTDHVAECIRAHRYRGGASDSSIEAKILFDADKLDVTGAMGVARTLAYQGQTGQPLYTRCGGDVCTSGEMPPSFVREYNFKLKKLYDRFNTARAAQIAAGRREAAERFYESLLEEVRSADQAGGALLRAALEK